MLNKFEQLEKRLHTSVALFYSTIEPQQQIYVNEQFNVEIYARELDPMRAGFQGVSLNVDWNPEILDIESWKVTDNLPLDQLATIKQDIGQLYDIGGSAFPAFGIGRPIGNLEDELFATLTFSAIKDGETLLELEQGKSRIATVPVSSLRSEHITFVDTNIEVLPRHNPNISEDVNWDGYVSAVDALMSVNFLNGDSSKGSIDVNNDGNYTALDALLVINELNYIEE